MIKEFIAQPGNKIIYLGDPTRCPPCLFYHKVADDVKEKLGIPILDLDQSIIGEETKEEIGQTLPYYPRLPQFFIFKDQELLGVEMGFRGPDQFCYMVNEILNKDAQIL